jgi:transcriptional regulator with XRE-family HTH domain
MPTNIKRLRALYGADGINQELLAKRAGLTRDRLLRIEKGYATPNAAEQRAIAKALRCTIAELGITPEQETA